MKKASYEESGDTETCVRTAADFVGRLLIETGGGDEAVTEMIYADGQARVRNPVSGKPTVLPKEQAAIIKRSFNDLGELGRSPRAHAAPDPLPP